MKQQVHPYLKSALLALAKRLRAIRVLKATTLLWFISAVALTFFLAAKLNLSYPILITLIAILVPIAALVLELRKNSKTQTDYFEAAKEIETLYPNLKQVLTTSIQQSGDESSYNFLQSKLLKQALKHPTRFYWDEIQRTKHRWLAIGEGTAKAVAIILALLVIFADSPYIERQERVVVDTSTSIEPGNVEIEKGSSVVITARYEGFEPEAATLKVRYKDGVESEFPMAKSLSDPIYAYTLQRIDAPLDYQVSIDTHQSGEYAVNIFEYPKLVKADANLDYPDYTRLDDRIIEDTKRISAVEGSRLQYDFHLNKPGIVPQLISEDGDSLNLAPSPDAPTLFTADFTLDKSARYTLSLVDAQGRSDPRPAKIDIDVLPNQLPILKFDFPKGDQRVSPIEEVQLAANASDDFGLIDYGLGFSFANRPVELKSLKSPDFEYQLSANFQDRVYLEEQGLKPAELVTWFIWARDFGPDGQERQTSSDLYFAEVRSLDEIFRESSGDQQQQQQQGQQGQGNQNQRLAEMQRQIAISLWKLQQSPSADASYGEDLTVIEESQETVRARLQRGIERLQEEEQIQAANSAIEFMDTVLDELSKSEPNERPSALMPSWSAAQGAYQALLKLVPNEFDVSRNQQNQSQGGQGQSQRQRQLNNLKFQTEENRYQTESQAQPIVSEEERQELESLSKLNELARRQQELNERLQELQNALANAADEDEKEKIRRELKRLEEEQREMISQLDQARQNMDSMSSTPSRQETKEQMDQTREQMQRTAENLEQEEVSQALASGSRAQEQLDNIREEFRENASNRFSEQLREARQAAREMTSRQSEIEEELEQIRNAPTTQLDDSETRDATASKMEAQRQQLEQLMDQIQQVATDSEQTEPTLHKELYNMLRRQSQNETDDLLETGSELLRQGFVDQSNQFQPEIREALESIEQTIEDAAERILGSESASLRFAQSEIDELTRRLGEERPEGQQPSGAGNPSEPQRQQNGEQASSGERSEDPSSNDSNRESMRGPAQSSPSQAESEQLAQSGQGSPQSESQNENQEPSQQQGQQANSQQQQRQQSGQQASNSQQQQPGSQSGQGQGNPPQQANNAPGQSQQPSQSPQQGGSSGGSPNQQLSQLEQSLEEFLQNMTGPGTGNNRMGPITGGDFVEWVERLRTIEELLEEPAARERLSQARERAEELRREYKRHGSLPQWGSIEGEIATPLNQVRSWLTQELSRIENPDTLQPVDRDPVP
ncbi:MAG: hypothetical protein AAGB46_03190, partial [Verrucomicrobiota bacterium]